MDLDEWISSCYIFSKTFKQETEEMGAKNKSYDAEVVWIVSVDVCFLFTVSL